MKKLFKSKTFLGAVMSIALCVSLIAGATFAIFTSEAKVNIAVSSGKVQVTATVEDFKLYSLENIDMTTLTGTEVDRTGAGKFVNGGEATLEGNAITLERMTPGDKVTFKINVANESNVTMKYRTLLSVKDEGLFEALKISVGGRTRGNASDWTVVTEADALSSEECVIELPAAAGNQYQDKSCSIVFIVEAVQGNVDENTVANGEVYDEEQLRYALYNAPTDGTQKVITLKSDITLEMLYAAENFGTETVADNAEGDTFNCYKLGVHPSVEDPTHWNSIVVEQTQEERVVYGAYIHAAAGDERIARLVVKAGQNVVIDLNGYTIKKASRATHGDWSNTCTNIIGNYGTLTLTDSSEKPGTVKGIGYKSCSGAVIHNYEGATCTVEKINVNGNAEGKPEGTGQYVISNEGGTMVIDSANVYDTATSASLLVSTEGSVTVKGNTVLTHKYTKTVNCKGGEIIIEGGVKLVSDVYAVYAAGGTVTVNNGVVIAGTGILYEDGGEIINGTDYQVKQKLTSAKIINDLKGGNDVTVEDDTQLDGEIDEDGNVNPDREMQLKDAGDVNLVLNGTLTSGNLSGYTYGCMRIMPGTKLTVSANEKGKFVNKSSDSIFNVCGGEVVVNGGKFDSETACFHLYTLDDANLRNSKLVINGGTFNAKTGIVAYKYFNCGTVVINGGTFKSENGIVVSDKYEWDTGRYSSNSLTITVNGGKFYNWDPSAYIDENHQVVTSAEGADTVYTVTAK